MKKLIITFFVLLLSLSVSANNMCSNQAIESIKKKISYLVTSDEYDACAQDYAFDDPFFIDKVKDIEYLIIFLAKKCELGEFEGYKNINDLLTKTIAVNAEAVDILVCNKIIDTVRNELIALRMFVSRPVQVEYDPLNGSARSITWQDNGFRHILHLESLTLHGRYKMWKKGELTILPYDYSRRLKRERSVYFLGKILRSLEEGKITLTKSQKKLVDLAVY